MLTYRASFWIFAAVSYYDDYEQYSYSLGETGEWRETLDLRRILRIETNIRTVPFPQTQLWALQFLRKGTPLAWMTDTDRPFAPAARATWANGQIHKLPVHLPCATNDTLHHITPRLLFLTPGSRHSFAASSYQSGKENLLTWRTMPKGTQPVYDSTRTRMQVHLTLTWVFNHS